MPIPIIVGIAAGVAGLVGIGSGIEGANKMKEANETIESANSRHNKNLKRYEEEEKKMKLSMDNLGKKELQILKELNKAGEILEKARRGNYKKKITINGIDIEIHAKQDFEKASAGADMLLGGLSSAALGTAGSFAAAGAVTAAVTAIGTASTGTAIATLSGAAATNAVLATLGGGAIAAGGGGVALGSAVLGAATAGIGILVGGIALNISGSKLSEKADDAWAQMKSAEKQIDGYCDQYRKIVEYSKKYISSLSRTWNDFEEYLEKVKEIVAREEKYSSFDRSNGEERIIDKTCGMQNLLYDMCNLKFLIQKNNDVPSANAKEIERMMENVEKIRREGSDIDVEL